MAVSRGKRKSARQPKLSAKQKHLQETLNRVNNVTPKGPPARKHTNRVSFNGGVISDDDDSDNKLPATP